MQYKLNDVPCKPLAWHLVANDKGKPASASGIAEELRRFVHCIWTNGLVPYFSFDEDFIHLNNVLESEGI